MKEKQPTIEYIFEQARATRSAQPPSLDTHAIMEAVRREAAARPVKRAAAVPVIQLPTWLCAVAASLAIVATAGTIGTSVYSADTAIGRAWLDNISPGEMAQTIDGATYTLF